MIEILRGLLARHEDRRELRKERRTNLRSAHWCAVRGDCVKFRGYLYTSPELARSKGVAVRVLRKFTWWTTAEKISIIDRFGRGLYTATRINESRAS